MTFNRSLFLNIFSSFFSFFEMDEEDTFDSNSDENECSMSSLHDFKKSFKRNALSVFDVYPGLSKSPKLHCSMDELKNCCNEVGTVCNCENDCFDLSESTNSFNSCSSSIVFNDNISLSVRCLEPYEDLKEKCHRLGLLFFDGYTQEKEYEVELILEHKVEEGQKFYLVKWKNWDMDTNTWEPDYNLTGCNEIIDYYETLQNPRKPFSKSILNYFIKELISRKPYDYLSLVKVVSIVIGTSVNLVKKMNLTVTQLRLKARDILELPLHKLENENIFELMRFAEKRKSVLINLQEWEYNINSFNPSTYIEVENNEDLERAPADFLFIHDYVAEDIDILREPFVFCECDTDCLTSKHKCCPGDSEAHFAYNKFRRLQLLPGYPIYECNNLCKCDKNCVNRVVQHGPKIKVAIFRTSNGCGWGLKTLETITKDQFVVEYLGEILTSEAAEIRGREYDNVGRSYLFDLDYGEENCKYTVDAGHLGNASHFINHSCDPNLHVFAVWINNQDPNMPRLAFFAKRRIQRGEELTFDYKMVKGQDSSRSLTNTDEGRVLCKCNSRKCRKYLC